MKRIACLGEVMIELSPIGRDSAQIGVAGDTYNTAVYLRRSLDSADAGISYVTALGNDAMSARIEAALKAEGISTELIEHRTGGSPGLYMITRDGAGERHFSYWRSASAARSLFQEPCDVTLKRLGAFDLVYLSGISIAILPQSTRDAICAWADGYRAKGGKIAFDSNYRPRLWPDVETARRETIKFWRRCDVALPSLDDEMALFGETEEAAVLARLSSAGVSFGALKRGERGPRSLDPESMVLDVTPVKGVVDTTAAGDSFNAGFLAGYVLGKDVRDCLTLGHELSCKVIQHPGAILPKEGTGG